MARSSAFCPDCDREISFNPHPRLGQTLVCPHCDADLEVISADPVELDWAFAWSDEEWDEDDEDDEDDDEDW